MGPGSWSEDRRVGSAFQGASGPAGPSVWLPLVLEVSVKIQSHVQLSALTINTSGVKLTSTCYLSTFLCLKVELSY